MKTKLILATLALAALALSGCHDSDYGSWYGGGSYYGHHDDHYDGGHDRYRQAPRRRHRRHCDY